MTTAISQGHLHIFCATVLTVFTSLPWGLILYSASRLPKKGHLPPFLGEKSWLNSVGLESNGFRGTAVLIESSISASRRSTF
jgi:hypothetical protein